MGKKGRNKTYSDILHNTSEKVLKAVFSVRQYTPYDESELTS